MSFADLINAFVTVVLGLLGMPLTTWLKHRFNLADTWALILSAAVAVVLALVQLFGTGYFTGTAISWENFGVIFWAVWGIASAFYKLFRYGQEAVK